jgi:predicted dehydrogenase
MTRKVLICGAGSIGNHLCFACRNKKWDVDIYDIDPAALARTQHEIYPSRYGSWDDQIKLINQLNWDAQYDLIIVGTPPDTHIDLMIDLLSKMSPKVLLVEKPFCTPDFERYDELTQVAKAVDTIILVGYNHNLTRNTLRVEELIAKGYVGEPLSIHVRWLEHWGGIFSAHPWLDGPAASYLGHWKRGGGACGEHSHGISLWQHFAGYLGAGDIKHVSAYIDMTKHAGMHHDRTAQLALVTESGLCGSVIQDVITEPAQKMARIQGEKGFIEWYANYDAGKDVIIYDTAGDTKTVEEFPKQRPDDFVGEIHHVDKLLNGEISESPIELKKGVQTMRVIAAAYRSSETGERVTL